MPLTKTLIMQNLKNLKPVTQKQVTLSEIKKLKGKVSPQFYQFMLDNHKEIYNY